MGIGNFSAVSEIKVNLVTNLRGSEHIKYIYSGRPDWLDTAPVAKVIKEAQQEAKK